MQMQKIKKVASGALGLFLTGATLMGPALAAADLSDFQNMGPSDTIIVVGASAITADVVGGINIGGKLAQSGIESATCSVSCADSGTSQVEGGVKIETKTKSLRSAGASQYSDFSKVKASLSSKDLDLLQKETVTYTDGTTTSYTQLLTLSSDAKTYFTEDDSEGDKVESPRVVLKQPSSKALYTYKLIAASGLDTRDPDATTNAGPGLTGEDVNIMGKTFTIGVQADIDHQKLVLYGGGEEKTLVAGGDAVSFELDGETHTIKMTSWTGSSATTLKGVFLLDGVQYEKAANSAITVDPVTNSQITIKKLSETKMPSVAGGAATEGASATIFIGSAKLTLDNATGTIKKGDDAIDGAEVVFTNTTNAKITSITITYTPDDRMVADIGETLTDPVFGAVEYVFSGYSEADNDGRDLVRAYKSSSTKLKLGFTNNEGDEYDIDLATLKAASDWVLGGSTDATTLHVDQNPKDITKNDHFFLSDGENSYVMKYTAIDTTDNEITIKNAATLEEIPIVYDGSGDGTFQVGAQSYTIENASDSTKKFDILDADPAVGSTGADVVMYTRFGHKFTVGSDPYVLIYEYDDQTDTDLAVMNVSTALSTSKTEIEEVNLLNATGAANNGGLASAVTVEDSKTYNAMSVYGSLLVDDTDADDVRLYMPDDQVTYDVYVMKAGVSPPTMSLTGTTVSQTVSVEAPSLGNGIAKLDSVTTAADKEAKNLILVGGPAANKLVEELATAGKTPNMAYWMSDLQGKYILQAVEDAFATGKTAIVVAGWEAADTQAASLKLATEDVSGAAVSCLGTSCEAFTYPAEEEAPAEEDE